jgi:hypothetical protein
MTTPATPCRSLLDGTETGSTSTRTASDAIGWRSACECGWRGLEFYSRRERPSRTGTAPEGVDGWESGTSAFAEWGRHLDRVLPELAVHDPARQLADVEERLRNAVQAARFAACAGHDRHGGRCDGGRRPATEDVGSDRRQKTLLQGIAAHIVLR